MKNSVSVIALASALTILVSACGGRTTTVTVTVAPPSSRVVPFVLGLRERLAVLKLTGNGLGAHVTHHASTSKPRGIVYAQAPAPGTKLAQGATVMVAVSTGKQ
jgi:beta-lactam-binding protein with PASTA domain